MAYACYFCFTISPYIFSLQVDFPISVDENTEVHLTLSDSSDISAEIEKFCATHMRESARGKCVDQLYPVLKEQLEQLAEEGKIPDEDYYGGADL